MANNDIAIQGTDLKYRVEINCPDFDLSVDELEVFVTSRSNDMPVAHTDSLSDDGLENKAAWFADPDACNAIYVCIPTRNLPCAALWLMVKAHVPDPDFPDGERTEIAKLKLCTITPQRP